jgi:glutathione S-transferase
MIIYGSSISPFVRKTLAAAAEKGLAVENKVSAPGNPDPDFIACSPFRKIPALRDGDFTVCDSSAIVHYMEGVQPQPALIPAEAKARARVIWFEEFADTIVVGAAGPIFFNRVVAPKFMGKPGDEAAADKAEKEALPPVMDYLEGVVPEPGGFLVGDSVTLADIAVASPFVNLRHLNLDLSRWPRTLAYVDSILSRPSFAPLIETENRIFGRAA